MENSYKTIQEDLGFTNLHWLSCILFYFSQMWGLKAVSNDIQWGSCPDQSIIQSSLSAIDASSGGKHSLRLYCKQFPPIENVVFLGLAKKVTCSLMGWATVGDSHRLCPLPFPGKHCVLPTYCFPPNTWTWYGCHKHFLTDIVVIFWCSMFLMVTSIPILLIDVKPNLFILFPFISLKVFFSLALPTPPPTCISSLTGFIVSLLTYANSIHKHESSAQKKW